MDDRLKSYKNEKLKRWASTDAQLLSLAQEEMQLKRKFVGDMARMDEDHKKTMQVLTENVTKMTDTFTAGFAMLQQLVINQTSIANAYSHLLFNVTRSYISKLRASYKQQPCMRKFFYKIK